MTIPHDAALRLGHFYKALAGNKESCLWCEKNEIDYKNRAAGEGVNSAGGFLVPDDFEASLSTSGFENVGVFRANTNVHRTTSGYQVQPRHVGGLTASFTAEGTAITQSSFTLGAIDVSLKRLAILATCSSELFEDSAVDVGTVLTTEINYAMGLAEDDAAFNGDGSPTYGGIYGLSNALAGLKSTAVCAGTHNTMAEVSSDDIGAVVALVQSSALTNAAWYVSPAGFGAIIARLSVLTGGLIATYRPDGVLETSYLGYRVVVSPKVVTDGTATTDLAGKPMLYFGDMSRASVLVERGPTQINLSWHRLLDQDSVMIRATRRIDIVHHGIGSASDRGAIAVLNGTT